MFIADSVSTLGDQFARVALALLVFDRTGSAWWTASIYAATFLPDLIGSFALSWVADYYPRRPVIVIGSLVQAFAFALMAIPGIALWIVGVLVAVSATALAPARAAQSALVADVLPNQLLTPGQGLLDQSRTIGQVVGLASGGALVAGLGSTLVLVLNAATFVVSAVVVRIAVPAFPAPGGSRRPVTQWRDTLSVLRADRELLALIVLVWMAAIVVVPDGVVVPLAAELGDGRATVGLLLAVHPLVLAVTLPLVTGHVARRRPAHVVWVLAVFAVLPLAGFVFMPNLAGALVLLALSGAGTAYMTLVKADVMVRLPTRVRGTANGLIRTGLRVGQGLGVAAGGAAAQLTGSTMLAIGAAGALGCCWVAGARMLRPKAAAPAS